MQPKDFVTRIPPHQISFDPIAFDAALRSQGVQLEHYSAVRCPVGMTDIDDARRPHPDHSGCTNGFLYTKVGTITALFVNNSKQRSPDDMGFYDGSTVQVSFPRTYDDPEGTPFLVAPFDRFYLAEPSIVVPTWQLFLHHDSGIDRFKYPVEKVSILVDAAGVRYTEGDDFKVKAGAVEWLGTRPTPQLDVGPLPSSTRGSVCSIRYLYRPYWYVGQILHELRVSQVSADGTRTIERMPQAAVLHREYVSLTRNQNEPGDPASEIDADALRKVLGPMSGGVGPK